MSSTVLQKMSHYLSIHHQHSTGNVCFDSTTPTAWVVSSLCHACVSHPCHTCVTLVSPLCHACVTLASHLCHTCVTLASHLCHTFVTVVSHLCHTCVTLVSCLCHTYVTHVSHMCHTCVTLASHLHHVCVTLVSRLCHTCVTLVFDLFQQKLHKNQQTWGGSTTVKKQIAGTASSVAFTPLQVGPLVASINICGVVQICRNQSVMVVDYCEKFRSVCFLE